MAVYASTLYQATVATTTKSCGYIVAGTTTRRGLVFDMNMGAWSAPASTDTNIIFTLERMTATAGSTMTAYVPVLVNPADAAFVGKVGLNNGTVEPTITAAGQVFTIGMNQRAPFRWQTYLGSGAELAYAATTDTGFALRVTSLGYTGQAGAQIYHTE
jgi:hypothetical protein